MHPLLSIFEKNVAAAPRRVAFGDQSLVLDYRGLRAVAAGLAGRIRSESRQPRVGIMAPTSAAGGAAVFACWYAGRTPVPLNFLLGPAELVKIIRDAGLDGVIAVDLFAEKLAPTGLKVIPLNARTLVPGDLPAPHAEAGDIAAVIYTSGTSGDPKGVCLSFDNLLQNTRAAIEHARMTSDHVFLSVIPQFHSFGLTVGTVIPPLLGASVWYVPRFSPAGVIGLIAEKKVSIFVAIASMFGALAKMKTVDPAALASLTLPISGGEPLPAAVAAAFKERFGHEIMEGYGMTETSPVIAVNMPWAYRPGSVGRAMPGIEVAIVDTAGQVLQAGEIGELVIRGHCVMQGYLNKPEATAGAIRDGRLHTGDMGFIDPDGFIHLTGRAKEMLIVGGENVFPGEIEAVLCAHPAVAEAAVIGQVDPVRGEIPVAYVILNENAEIQEQDLRVYCRDKLAGYKVPREIRITRELPRGPTGKILKRALKTMPTPSSAPRD
jgi:long-chain acyl-CoA synthetase